MKQQYEAMSNFDLSQQIARNKCAGQDIEWLPQRSVCDLLLPDLMDDKCYFITPMGHEQSFDINNANQMMPLVFEAGISLVFMDSGYEAHSLENGDEANNTQHENGLRAAAIVWLMMKAGE